MNLCFLDNETLLIYLEINPALLIFLWIDVLNNFLAFKILMKIIVENEMFNKSVILFGKNVLKMILILHWCNYPITSEMNLWLYGNSHLYQYDKCQPMGRNLPLWQKHFINSGMMDNLKVLLVPCLFHLPISLLNWIKLRQRC